jgi:hypothetical protein
VLAHRYPPCSADRLETETRSKRRIVHCAIDVKSWATGAPSCEAVRPSCCAACAAASREPGRALRIVGHGRRTRTVEGPLAPGEEPALTGLLARRYRCRACGAILVVVPAGVGRAYRYSLGAIALALSLWAYERATAAQVRARTSTAKTVGAASATRWASLPRWTRSALGLFGVAPGEDGTLRERAAKVATFVAAQAPIALGPVRLDAFFGASFCCHPE